MSSTPSKALVGVLAIAVAIALYFVLRDDDSPQSPTTVAETTTTTESEPADGEQSGERPERPDKPPQPQVETITVENGQPIGGIAELSFVQGETIRFKVESDVADEVHLHGYDVAQDVAAGGSTEFNVPATIEGVFEVELEDRVVPLAEVVVEPG